MSSMHIQTFCTQESLELSSFENQQSLGGLCDS